jgi:RNA polymerase sigma-70 factor (ECF subfamily)
VNLIPEKPPEFHPEAFAELYIEYHPRVVGLCSHLLGSKDDAEDAASDVFARLPKAIKTYDRAQPFSRWLSRVAANYCVDLLRIRRSEQRLFELRDAEAPDPAAPDASPLQDLLSSEERERVRTAVARLPERYRVPLVLRYYHELTYNEIARILGLNRGNVATLIFRAKEALRRTVAANPVGTASAWA